jgi:hypothetical protein
MYSSTFSRPAAVVGGEWSASHPDSFTPGERAPGTHWIGGWVDPRAGLDDVEKSKFLTQPGLELRPLSRPAPSQSTLSADYAIPAPTTFQYICSYFKPFFLNTVQVHLSVSSITTCPG